MRMRFNPNAILDPSQVEFFFNGPATSGIYTLSLHDALPISPRTRGLRPSQRLFPAFPIESSSCSGLRSEEHTSELQSRGHLVCRLLLEKKNELPETLIVETYPDPYNRSDILGPLDITEGCIE